MTVMIMTMMVVACDCAKMPVESTTPIMMIMTIKFAAHTILKRNGRNIVKSPWPLGSDGLIIVHGQQAH